jgi:hypothetical protein
VRLARGNQGVNPAAASILGHRTVAHNDYRRGVGFNPFRQQVKRRSDIVLVVGAVLVVAALVLWAALPR